MQAYSFGIAVTEELFLVVQIDLWELEADDRLRFPILSTRGMWPSSTVVVSAYADDIYKKKKLYMHFIAFIQMRNLDME